MNGTGTHNAHVTSGAATLRRQLLTWVSLPILVLWSVSAYIDYGVAKRFVNTAYDRTLLESALDIGRQIKVLRGRIYIDLPEVAVQMLRSRERGQLYYLVTGPDREYISGEPDLTPPPLSLPEQVRYYDDVYRGLPVRVAVAQFPVETEEVRGQVTVQVAETLPARTDLVREVLLRMALPQALLGIIAVVVLWFAVGRGLAPLRGLREAIEQRSHRDLAALPASQAPREVRPLIDAMNGLMQRLGGALNAQQRFIADAAHQLRTPIAGLRTQTELALRQTTPEDMKAVLEQLETATERMTHLVNQLLSLARAEPAADRLQVTERIDLDALARALAAEWVPRALTKNIDLGYESYDGASDACMLDGDTFLLRELLTNLIDNAIRYTQNGGHVTVRVAANKQKIILSVEDDGLGIPEAERERVLERFYRVLGTGTEGCGLGLAIVREIAARHRGEVTLASGAGNRGTLVRVTFPR
jgi:two-component system sensor histidine kinase TctE